MEQFHEIDPRMTMTQALTLLYADEEPTQRDIERRLGTTMATASRGVGYWSDRKIKGEMTGHGYLHQEVNPDDTRYRVVTPTRIGRAFLDKLIKIVGD